MWSLIVISISFLSCLNQVIEVVTSDKVESRIYNGIDVRRDVHKHLVLLEIPNTLCSGSIISEYWIITAAHCLDSYRGLTSIKIYHHHDNLSKPIASAYYNKIHSQYKTNERQNYDNVPFDIALLKTTQAISFNEWVQPVKLTDRMPRVGQLAITAGYGKTEDRNLPLPREAIVRLSEPPIGKPNYLVLYSKGVALGSGDSGGPLVTNMGLIGINSAFYTMLDGLIMSYVSIYPYLSWINNVIYTQSE